MPNKQLKTFLDQHHVRYLMIDHSRSYTAQEIAATSHIPGKQFAKTIIIKSGSKFFMVVIPATDHINFNELKEWTGTEEVDLASESEFRNKFPECEIGAMPPFGNLYDMPVLVSDHLSTQENIAFNAGSHTELIKMSFYDFEQLVHPKIISMH